MTRFIQVTTSVNSKKTADRIARKLLEERLAACVQVLGPIDSRYWWENRIEHAREWFCFAKARSRDYRGIQAAVKKIHPYDVPEILSFPILDGNPDYLEWIRKTTTQNRKRRIRRGRN
jgi:periplasmic divalent cation tolerance protein